MNCVGPTFSEEALGALRDDYAFTPAIDELASVLALFSHPTRLKIFALLDQSDEMCVCDLSSVLGVSVSAVSQNLAKFRALNIVKYRRDAQTLYYTLTDHRINTVIRGAVGDAREQLPG
jgi:DNA-binding transcriptional ArsR family regulator